MTGGYTPEILGESFSTQNPWVCVIPIFLPFFTNPPPANFSGKTATLLIEEHEIIWPNAATTGRKEITYFSAFNVS
jgi:hypothetical protein